MLVIYQQFIMPSCSSNESVTDMQNWGSADSRVMVGVNRQAGLAVESVRHWVRISMITSTSTLTKRLRGVCKLLQVPED